MTRSLVFCIITTLCCLHAEQRYPFSLEPLGYSFDGLEPYIDKATMEVHYTGHHAAYVKNLNDALKEYPVLQRYTLSQIMTMLKKLPAGIRSTVQNNAGGHINHTFFWRCMSPEQTKPSQKILKALKTEFGSLQAFKDKFNEAAKKVFGSGWAWLCYDPRGKKLVIISTPNQNSPLTESLTPLLGLDVWEHAYYLKHKNQRLSYIEAWWNVINWSFVEENYTKAALK